MGQLIRGTLVRSATITANGNGTAYQIGALASGQQMVATIHVTGVSASDTIQIVIESDSAEGFPSPATQATSSVFAAIGFQQLSVSGPITDTWWRARAVVTGSGVSIPIVVTMGITNVTAAGSVSDPHLALITALGGDSEVLAFYVTSNGITGLADASVEHSAGVVDEWNDYRGGAFAPLLAGIGTERPAWDAGTLEIIGDGVDDRMATAANAIFDLATAKTVISVAVLPSNEFSATIADDTTARYLGIAQLGSNIAAKSSGGNLDSGVPLSATRRVIFSSSNGTTTLASEVANHARQTSTITEIAAGTNKLFAFTYGPSPANTSAAKVKAMIVLNREYTSGDRALITTWAITYLGAVAAA